MNYLTLSVFSLLLCTSEASFSMFVNGESESESESSFMDSEEDVDEDEETVDEDEEAIDEEDIPSPEQLKQLFPTIMTVGEVSGDEARTILFLYLHKDFNPEEIGLIVDLDTAVVLDILRKNGIQKVTIIDKKIKAKCFEAYLRFFKSITNKEITRVQFASALGAHPEVGFSAPQILNIFTRANRKSAGQRDLTPDELHKIVKDYQSGASLFELVQTYRFITRVDTIIEHLANALSPSQFRDSLQLTISSSSPSHTITKSRSRKKGLHHDPSIRNKPTLKTLVMGFYDSLSEEQKTSPKRYITAFLAQHGRRPHEGTVNKIIRECRLRGAWAPKKTLKSLVLEFYNSLSDEQKKSPKRHITALLAQCGRTPNRGSITKILRKAGLPR